MIGAADELHAAATAVRLGMDWRPLFGLSSADAGTPVERIASLVVLDAAVEAHNDEHGKGG